MAFNSGENHRSAAWIGPLPQEPLQSVRTSRLDRALCDAHFLDLWTSVQAHTLARHCSDHNPIVVSCNISPAQGPKPFRFRSMWTKHDHFLHEVASSWKEPITDSKALRLVTRKLKRLKLRF